MHTVTFSWFNIFILLYDLGYGLLTLSCSRRLPLETRWDQLPIFASYLLRSAERSSDTSARLRNTLQLHC